MKNQSLEDQLILYASPTLANLKCANLFTYYYKSEEAAYLELDSVNERLNARGVYLMPLQWCENGVRILAYRKSALTSRLRETEAVELLRECGYREGPLLAYLLQLAARLEASEGFPHEIGIFLDYPLEDVRGFMENCGQNCKCCGFWKVYGDEEKAKRRFAMLEKCRQVYGRTYEKGCSLIHMTVCA